MDESGSVSNLLSYLNTGGTIAVLVLALVGFYTGKIVPKYVLDRSDKRGDEWQRETMRTTDLAERLMIELERSGFDRARIQHERNEHSEVRLTESGQREGAGG